jgi:hypothetical protein
VPVPASFAISCFPVKDAVRLADGTSPVSDKAPFVEKKSLLSIDMRA